MQRLDLVVGANGSGKTTFVRLVLSPALPPGTPFVNADEIAKALWPDSQSEHAYQAAQRAAATRTHLIAAGRSFIAETVFSHASKLELIHTAQLAGYAVHLHVLVIAESVAVARVAYRVQAGGHSVPEQKIRQRYQRLWPLVAAAISRADRAQVYDNSSNTGPRLICQYSNGMALVSPAWPPWTPQPLKELSRS